MPVTDRPNILFFLTDDQRFDTIAPLGNSAIRTPNLDRLVQRGTAFTDAYIMGGSCGAVCMPSRAMLHTSRSLYHIQDMGRSVPADHSMLGETLRGAGYDTFGTGKWHNGAEAFSRSFSHGGDIFFGGMGDHWNVPACDFDPAGRYEARIAQTTNFHTQSVQHWTADHIEAGVHSTELFCDAAVDFLTNRQRRENPFFAYVAFMAPHDPRTMPQKYLDMYPPEKVKLPPNFLPEHYFDNGELQVRDEVLAAIPRDEVEVRQHIAAYYAMITHLDDHIGRVLQVLEDQGMLEDTIIVFAGDNGLAVGQHGLLGKQNLYEHSVRVPLIFAGPGVPENQQRSALAGPIDIFPTLCDLVDIEKPASAEGESLQPCFNDREAFVRKTMLFAYRHLMRGVRDRSGKKLIETAAAGQCYSQLFDLRYDRWEMENLAGDPKHAETMLLLRESLTTWRDDWDDVQPGQGADFWQQMDWADR